MCKTILRKSKCASRNQLPKDRNAKPWRHGPERSSGCLGEGDWPVGFESCGRDCGKGNVVDALEEYSTGAAEAKIDPEEEIFVDFQAKGYGRGNGKLKYKPNRVLSAVWIDLCPPCKEHNKLKGKIYPAGGTSRQRA